MLLHVLLFISLCFVGNVQTSRETIYYKSDGILIEETVGSLTECFVLGDRELISKKLKSLPVDSIIIDNTRDEIHNIIEMCPTKHRLSRIRRSVELIYPGTKWCGVGNISKDFEDLGVFRETDICCREHDYCPDYISPYQSKYGLENNSPFVRLNCGCDNKFYDCLKKSQDQAGRIVGDLYFNFILSQCFTKQAGMACTGKRNANCTEENGQMVFVSDKVF